MFEYGLSGKWLELLKQIAPGVTRVAVLRDPTIVSGIGQFGAIQSAAPSLGMEATPINVRDVGDIERDIAGFAASHCPKTQLAELYVHAPVLDIKHAAQAAVTGPEEFLDFVAQALRDRPKSQ